MAIQLNELFSSFESFEIDNRERVFEFEVYVPSFARTLVHRYEDDIVIDETIRIGLIPLSFNFWVQSFILLCLQSLFNIMIALAVYYLIVKPQQQLDDDTNHIKKSLAASSTTRRSKGPLPSTSSNTQYYIIGYGLICPFLLLWPFILFQHILEIKNIALMLCLTGAVPNLLLLRVTEAVHGMLPDFCYQSQSTTKQHRQHDEDVGVKLLSSTTSSSEKEKNNPLVMLILYYSATLQFQFDPKTHQPVPLTGKLLRKKLVTFISVFLQTSLLYSFLIPFHYQPFSEPTAIVVDSQQQGLGMPMMLLKVWYFYHPAKLANSFLLASLLSLVLDGTSFFQFVLFVKNVSICTNRPIHLHSHDTRWSIWSWIVILLDDRLGYGRFL
jgi:hypothetical protein